MAASLNILVVEDDPAVVLGLIEGLSAQGWRVTAAMNGAEGLRRAREGGWDLVLLDLMLPQVDGLEILEAMVGSATPVFVLSARDALASRLEVFERGAVDFIPKPFWMEELVARIRGRLAPGSVAPARTVSWADATLDLDARVFRGAGGPVELTPTEFAILAWLVQRPGRAVSRAQLADGALEGEAEARTVDSHLSRLRKKIGAEAAGAIRTVWGIGWRFEP